MSTAELYSETNLYYIEDEGPVLAFQAKIYKPKPPVLKHEDWKCWLSVGPVGKLLELNARGESSFHASCMAHCVVVLELSLFMENCDEPLYSEFDLANTDISAPEPLGKEHVNYLKRRELMLSDPYSVCMMKEVDALHFSKKANL